ncbi:MAG TPA: ABC transporter ATP-binding protein [Solirubrobacteraceae bacterium]
MTEPILEVRGLRRSFGTREVLTGVDLEIGPGERVALRGPNGSGKSTLLRCVLGALTPTAGEVRVDGNVAGTIAARRLVGATFSQDRSFYLRLSGRENLRFFARLRLRDARRADEEVERLGEELELDRVLAQRVDRCSTGMVQQLGFARALLAEPRLLILDEPTRSLDDAAVGRLWGALDRRPETAVLFATHRVEDVARCQSERVLAQS